MRLLPNKPMGHAPSEHCAPLNPPPSHPSRRPPSTPRPHFLNTLSYLHRVRSSSHFSPENTPIDKRHPFDHLLPTNSVGNALRTPVPPQWQRRPADERPAGRASIPHHPAPLPRALDVQNTPSFDALPPFGAAKSPSPALNGFRHLDFGFASSFSI